jgi:type II secretory pathway pseudopilin PulG
MKMISKKVIGFTLIELLIYIAILSIMTVVVADSFLILNKGRGGVEAKSELNSNFRFTVERMKRDITAASALNSPATTAATSTTLSLTIGTSTVNYALSANRVSRQVDSNPLEYITADTVKINSLFFTRLENINTVLNKKRISVEINISGAYNSASPDYQYFQSDKTSVDLNQDF